MIFENDLLYKINDSLIDQRRAMLKGFHRKKQYAVVSKIFYTKKISPSLGATSSFLEQVIIITTRKLPQHPINEKNSISPKKVYKPLKKVYKP
jgi:hypothetical protein